MDQIGEIILRVKISEHEEHLVLREIDRVALNREIEDPKTEEDERYLATIRRDRTIIEWGELMIELQGMRERHAHELEITSRWKLN